MQAGVVNTKIAKLNKPQDALLSIVSETKSDPVLNIGLNEFIMAQANSNYTSIWYLNEKKVQSKLLRLKLKSVAEQLHEHKTVIRCHKSYLVNKNKIVSSNGNARSLNFIIDGIEQCIPVSRSFDKNLI